MFLKSLIRNNRSFVEAAIRLHQAGLVPPNSYIIDLETLAVNARVISGEAAKYHLKVFAMTKQIGRNPVALRTIKSGGIGSCVAVDVACARPIHATGLKVGNVGHLVQVPRSEAKAVAAMAPEYWTVFSQDKATEASEAASLYNRNQSLLARVFSPGDRFYMGQEGGFPAEDIVEAADAIDVLPNATFAGITTFPALLFDHVSGQVKPTQNLKTLEKAAELLVGAGRQNVEINAPGTTSSSVIKFLADSGATQIEPGHGLTGTTPLHAVRELPELPAVLYLSEISHEYGGHPYCFGGGLYIDPVFPSYEVNALVGSEADRAIANPVPVKIPPADAIDYYGILNPREGMRVRTGDSVIFGFRIQAFVTRAYVVPISGISTRRPKVEGIFTTDGREIKWPSW